MSEGPEEQRELKGEQSEAKEVAMGRRGSHCRSLTLAPRRGWTVGLVGMEEQVEAGAGFEKEQEGLRQAGQGGEQRSDARCIWNIQATEPAGRWVVRDKMRRCPGRDQDLKPKKLEGWSCPYLRWGAAGCMLGKGIGCPLDI